ncbi:beta-ketoacyl-[acyl-carrier-protein] synthase family protein [Janthinobacterium fluminis]|uniref:Beta-ketoacyl synthase N-terminal-like domain-containing protein n=1 Tax=Janthinobacterium fluminis TaxID=2987524 RepID=A0ABT5K1T8_9BURK|nr:beta-ketoacyl synthase N-terminal-like domain-containing protein [Janthinobacterium fluminis]MDC8758941.1 beta-ketoacyl synthase N-terminal-like domain-containing protein [Janthinobacterium fluminis]
MNAAHAIVITGMGVICPLGRDVPSYWRALQEDDAEPGRRDDAGFNSQMLNNTLCYGVAERGAAPAGSGGASGFALVAAREAMRDAGIDGARAAGMTVALAIGTGAGDSDVGERARLAGGPPEAGDLPYGVADSVAAELGCEGPVFTLSNACSASLYACAYAAELLLDGCADAVVVIGSESIGRVTQAGFERMLALDGEACRPFDARRRGTLLGEGAAALVLERADAAARRGAHVYGELLSYASNCDAHHPTAPRADGARAEAVMREALAHAALDAGAIDAIVPHGTGTQINDATESDILQRVFGDRLGAIPVCAIKSKLGHGAGAAGAFSLLTALLMLRDRLVPPMVNGRRFEPGCDLRFVTGAALAHPVRRVLVNAYAFGGNNMSMIVGGPP